MRATKIYEDASDTKKAQMQSTAYSVLAQMFQGKVPSLVKAVSPISEEAGTKIFEALCELYFPDMESAKHQKAKEMQKMLDERLPDGQDFKTWAMEADMKLADVRLLGDAFEDKTVINGVIGKLKISAEPWPQISTLIIFKMNELADDGTRSGRRTGLSSRSSSRRWKSIILRSLKRRRKSLSHRMEKRGHT